MNKKVEEQMREFSRLSFEISENIAEHTKGFPLELNDKIDILGGDNHIKFMEIFMYVFSADDPSAEIEKRLNIIKSNTQEIRSLIIEGRKVYGQKDTKNESGESESGKIISGG